VDVTRCAVAIAVAIAVAVTRITVSVAGRRRPTGFGHDGQRAALAAARVTTGERNDEGQGQGTELRVHGPDSTSVATVSAAGQITRPTSGSNALVQPRDSSIQCSHANHPPPRARLSAHDLPRL